MLTGQLPFLAESPVAVSLKHIQSVPISPRKLNSSIPAEIEEVILKAMAKSPEDRYQAARDLSIAFWKALQHELCQGPPATRQIDRPDSSAEAPQAGPAQPHTAGESAPPASGCQEGETPSHPQARPPIMPLRFPLTDKPGAMASVPATTSLPLSGPPAERLRSLTRRRILVCLLLLLLALPLGLCTWQTLHGPDVHLSPAQQAVATATALEQRRDEATLAAQARAAATAGVSGSLGAGRVLYADPLTGQDGGWLDDGSQCFFRPQGYHVQTLSAHEFAWCYSGRQAFSNAVISVQARLIRGQIYGLVFRLSPSAQQFYALEINAQGAYRFVLASGSDPSSWLTLIDWTRSPAILPGYNRTNTLLVVASGSDFHLYINRQLITTGYTNGSYPSGLVGCLVGGDASGGTEAVFTNMFVFQK
jgi:hypothetical protein